MPDDNHTEGASSFTLRGAAVVLVLHSPREKYWGVLKEISAAGVFVRCLELNAIDDWARAVNHGEAFIGLTDQFFPMWRVERVTRDEPSGEIPSLAQQFEARTNRLVSDFM
ncbi:MAG: hypothetical protein WKF30_16715 [Pyrinomonadaceae bacterium]